MTGQKKVNCQMVFMRVLRSSITGNRVQWFRAEADMQRWQEQTEVKLIEFLRCMQTYNKMAAVWTLLSQMQPDNLAGHAAYAKRTAGMYKRMEKECEKKFDEAGHKELRLSARNNYGEFMKYIIANRRKEEEYLNSRSV